VELVRLPLIPATKRLDPILQPSVAEPLQVATEVLLPAVAVQHLERTRFVVVQTERLPERHRSVLELDALHLEIILLR
jgi:hypothetical protein